LLEIGQRRKPGAEIVDRDVHPGVMQHLQHLDHLLGGLEKDILGNLDADLVRLQVLPPQGLQKIVQHALVDEILARQVDVHAHRFVSLVGPVVDMVAGLLQYPATDFVDQAGSLGYANKVGRADIVVAALGPANQSPLLASASRRLVSTHCENCSSRFISALKNW
jgi:hypothetical protein